MMDWATVGITLLGRSGCRSVFVGVVTTLDCIVGIMPELVPDSPADGGGGGGNCTEASDN